MSDVKRVFAVKGMTCQHCAVTVEGAIRSRPGVRSVHVNYLKKRAEVEGDASDEVIERAVREAGYEVTVLSGSGHA